MSWTPTYNLRILHNNLVVILKFFVSCLHNGTAVENLAHTFLTVSVLACASNIFSLENKTVICYT